ncbi:MAG: HlyD family type I secretion periplasmic adaptor subunit [Rubrimonas sp.]|uniref:HlyD family type I secretion periplasmic adaptor subunit n=1 Tax=Rubrimonas sp. TaxID=2036015 RepID=UPI002FDD782E
MTAQLRLEGPRNPTARWSAGRYVAIGLIGVVVLVFGLGAWSAFASIAGAVVSPGRLKVEVNRQVVQHLEGGVVSEIAVEEGQQVQAGEIVMRLDSSRPRAELAIIESQLFETMARIARLEAQIAGFDAPNFPAELQEVAAARPEVEALVDGQRRLFDARRDTVERETEQLRERQTQIAEEIAGAESQRESLSIQLGFIQQELTDQRSLLERGLTQASRVLALEREKARLDGQTGALTAQIAQARGRITEIDIQITGRDATRLEEAIGELRDLKTREAELRERRLSAQETLDRLDIRAPRSGIVLGKTVFTVGAVIRPAEPVMYIVPTEEALVVETRIDTTSIDSVYPGQPARLVFSAFNTRTTPELFGTVGRVSPDALTDEATGMSYYTAEIDIEDSELAKLEGLKLIAGMPVEAFIQTGERSPLSYMLKPMTDFFERSMREQ